MSEFFPSHPSSEQRRQESMQPFIGYELHGQQIDISLGDEPLVAKDEAAKAYGVNGDILATFTLPSSSTDPGNPAREIAIVDYGEPDPGHPKPIFVFEGQPFPRLGLARSRYGLAPLSYSTMPHGHLSHVDLPQGSLTLGRYSEGAANSRASYSLGLNDGVVGDDLISRRHITLTLADGKLNLADHSTNGTLVRIHNPEGTLSPKAIERLHSAVGRDALSAVGVEGAFPQSAYTNEEGVIDRVPWDTGASHEPQVAQPPSVMKAGEPPKEKEIENVSSVYGQIAHLAAMAGHADAYTLVNNINNLAAGLPDEQRKQIEDMTSGIVNEYGREVDRYGTGGKFGLIANSMRSRLASIERQILS